MKTGSKLCLLESPHGFPKSWPFDLAFDLTWANFDPGLVLMEINIPTKFHEDCIKPVLSEVYTWFF